MIREQLTTQTLRKKSFGHAEKATKESAECSLVGNKTETREPKITRMLEKAELVITPEKESGFRKNDHQKCSLKKD